MVEKVLSKFWIFVVKRLISIIFPSILYLGIPIQSPILRFLEVETCIPVTNPKMVSLKTKRTTAVTAPKTPITVCKPMPKITKIPISEKITIPKILNDSEIALIAVILYLSWFCS